MRDISYNSRRHYSPDDGQKAIYTLSLCMAPPITISSGQNSITATASSVSVPLWHRVFEDRQRLRPTTDSVFSIGLSRSLAAPLNTHKPPTPRHKGSNAQLPQVLTPHLDLSFQQARRQITACVHSKFKNFMLNYPDTLSFFPGLERGITV